MFFIYLLFIINVIIKCYVTVFLSSVNIQFKLNKYTKKKPFHSDICHNREEMTITGYVS